MSKNKQSDAQRRNWAKFLVCGIKGEIKHLLGTRGDVLSELEKEDLLAMEKRVNELVDNWDRGTKKLNV